MSATIAAPAPVAVSEDPPAKRSRGKLLIIAVVAVLALAGGGWFAFLKPAGAPQPGEVAPLESIQMNLQGGHYLRLGLALQLTKGSKEADGSKALDLAIDLFSGRTVEELARPGTRKKLKKELIDELQEAYEGEVMGVYFTEFVTQ